MKLNQLKNGRVIARFLVEVTKSGHIIIMTRRKSDKKLAKNIAECLIKLGKDYEKETILHELDRRERTYNQQRTNELRRARASIRETAEEVRREQRTLTPEQPEIRPARRNHEQHVERGTDHQQELSL